MGRDPLPDGDGIGAVHDQQEVGDADLDVAVGRCSDLVEIVDAHPKLHRSTDLARVPPDIRAVLVENSRRRGHLLGAAARRVPHVCVLRGDPQRPLRP